MRTADRFAASTAPLSVFQLNAVEPLVTS
jgi:hypothetical protein